MRGSIEDFIRGFKEFYNNFKDWKSYIDSGKPKGFFNVLCSGNWRRAYRTPWRKYLENYAWGDRYYLGSDERGPIWGDYDELVRYGFSKLDECHNWYGKTLIEKEEEYYRRHGLKIQYHESP